VKLPSEGRSWQALKQLCLAAVEQGQFLKVSQQKKLKNQFVSLCKQLATAAEKYNVVISLEPLNTRECNFINSLIEGAEIVQAVNHENFRLLADIYHSAHGELRVHRTFQIMADLIYHTHIAEKKPGRSANPEFIMRICIPYFRL